MLIGVQRLFLGTLKLMVGVHVRRDTFFVVSLFMYLQELTLIDSLTDVEPSFVAIMKMFDILTLQLLP